MNAESLRPLVFDILNKADLTTVSNKVIRQALEDRLGQSLREHKSLLAGITKQLYEEFTAAQRVSSSDEADDEPLSQALPAKKKQKKDKSAGGVKEVKKDRSADKNATKKRAKVEVKETKKTTTSSSASPTDNKKKKKEQAYTSTTEHDLAADERLARQLAAADARPSRQTPQKQQSLLKKRKRVQSRREVDSDDDTSTDISKTKAAKEAAKRSRGPIVYSGFNKLLVLSEDLSALLGLDQPYLSRPQVVKRIWAYVKERGLQDANDKRFINCDPALEAVFRTKKVHMFTMNKLLANHFLDGEVPAGYRPPDEDEDVEDFDDAMPSLLPPGHTDGDVK